MAKAARVGGGGGGGGGKYIIEMRWKITHVLAVLARETVAVGGQRVCKTRVVSHTSPHVQQVKGHLLGVPPCIADQPLPTERTLSAVRNRNRRSGNLMSYIEESGAFGPV